MRNTFAIAFYCRASRVNKQGVSPIEMSVSINTKRHFLNLPYKCNPQAFNRKHKPEEIEKYLYTVRKNINDYLLQMAEQQIAVTTDNLLDIIRAGGVHTYTLNDLFCDYLKILEKRIDVDMRLEHYQKYVLVRDTFFQTIDPNTNATSLTNADILRFKAHLGTTMQQSTLAGYMAKLKQFITFGINNQKIKINPFEGVKIKRIEKAVQTITQSDIETILHKEIDNDRLNRVRDIFLFAAGTGLAYADVIQIKPEDFGEKDGKVFISKERQKTGVKYFSVLLPFAVEIAKKYDYNLAKLHLSNQKCNSYLKEIQDICNITSVDSLHFHLARHYYATNAINSGVPLEIVQRLVGHANIKQTQHYAKLMTDTILQNIGNIL